MNRAQALELLATVYSVSPVNRLTDAADRARAEEVWILALSDVDLEQALLRVSEYVKTHGSGRALTPADVRPHRLPANQRGAASPAAGSAVWADATCNPIIIADHHVTHGDMTQADDEAMGKAVRHLVANPYAEVRGRLLWCKRCGTEEFYVSEEQAQQAKATHVYTPPSARLG